MLSKMFSLAEVWGLRPDGSNPCRHVKRYKENKREQFLSPEETERLGEILHEAESEVPSAVATSTSAGSTSRTIASPVAADRLPAVGDPVPPLGARQGRLHRATRLQDGREEGALQQPASRVPHRFGGAENARRFECELRGKIGAVPLSAEAPSSPAAARGKPFRVPLAARSVAAALHPAPALEPGPEC